MKGNKKRELYYNYFNKTNITNKFTISNTIRIRSKKIKEQIIVYE